MGCERKGQFHRLFPMRRAARIHVGKSPSCRKLGFGLREIRVSAGTGTDVMAGGAGAAGPAPDVRHQHPGNTHLKKFRISPKEQKRSRISQDILKIDT